MGDFVLPNLRDKPLSVLHVGRGFAVVDKLPNFLSVPGRGPDMDDCVVARVKEAVSYTHLTLPTIYSV